MCSLRCFQMVSARTYHISNSVSLFLTRALIESHHLHLHLYITSGTAEAMNMTAAIYLNEAKNQLDLEKEMPIEISDAEKESNAALRAMDSVLPLHEQIKPHFDQISSGLSNMSKIVGGSTNPRDASPGMLATFLTTKQSMEQDIVLPLKKMHALVETRQKYLDTIKDHQLKQLQNLQTMVKKLKDQMQTISKKKIMLESNTQLLSERSAAVLAAARDLSPNITEAEHQFFKDVQRYEASCEKYEAALEEIRAQTSSVGKDIKNGVKIDVTLTPGQKTLCDQLLDGQHALLQKVKGEVKKMEHKRDKLVVACGFEDERKPLTAITYGIDNN